MTDKRWPDLTDEQLTTILVGLRHDDPDGMYSISMQRVMEQLIRERDQLRAENEGLRETIAEWQEIHGVFTGDVHAACQAEIERLKREVDYWMNLDAAAIEAENERLRTQLESRVLGPQPSEPYATLAAETERLRAALEEALTIDHSQRGCCEWHILNGKPWIPLPTGAIYVSADELAIDKEC